MSRINISASDTKVRVLMPTSSLSDGALGARGARLVALSYKRRSSLLVVPSSRRAGPSSSMYFSKMDEKAMPASTQTAGVKVRMRRTITCNHLLNSYVAIAIVTYTCKIGGHDCVDDDEDSSIGQVLDAEPAKCGHVN